MENLNLATLREKFISIGTVVNISDGVAVIDGGLNNSFVGEVVSFGYLNSSVTGIVMDIEKDVTKVAQLTGDRDAIRSGDKVFPTRKGVQTRVGLGTLGRINSPLGECLNPEEFDYSDFSFQEIWNVRLKDVECAAPSIIEREPVRTPVLTGINAIDVLLPIGCGQRELIIGDNGSGKTSLALTILLHQNYKNQTLYKQWRLMESNYVTYKHRLFIPCIYVVIGGKRAEVSRLGYLMKNTNARNYTSIIFSAADDLAALQYIAPFAGCAVGEWFRNNGYKAIVVYDELLNHAGIYRQISLLLRRPPGREAYPGDVFYLHARLLERAAQMHRKLGGGALTALPLVETKSGDISGYIPTNIISITDGQIFLNQKIGNSGIKPAIDLNLSVSRIGSDAQYNIMKFISKKVKLAYGAYRNFQGVEKVGGNLDSYIMDIINKGKRLVEFFKQEVYQTEYLYKQVICLFAIVEGFMDELKPDLTQFYFSLMFQPEIASSFLKGKEKSLLYVSTHQDTLNASFVTLTDDVVMNEVSSFIKAYSTAFKTYYQYKVNNYVKKKI